MCTPEQFVRLDGDILTPYAGKKALFVHETAGFWEQVKSPGMTLKATELYLGHFRTNQAGALSAASSGGPQIVGNVYVHPSVKVHPSAKLGPNVSVAPNARIGAGARLMNCIILDGAEVRDHAVVSNAIVGWKSTLGTWSRVQGSGEYESKMGIAILGEDVSVGDEVVVVSCVVLPHKEIKASVKEEIIL